MSRQVGTAAIEGQPAPAAAKGGNAAIRVLQIKQPLHPGASRLDRLGIDGAQVAQGQQGSGGIVGIRNPTGKIRPGPPPGIGMGVWMQAAILLIQQPATEVSPSGPYPGGDSRFSPAAQGGERLRGHPGGQVGIDGPGPVGCERFPPESRGLRETTGCPTWPLAARLMMTKLVSGTASR